MPHPAAQPLSLASPTVLAAFVSFALSVGAAGLAINLYSLLRTGRMGASWRVLTIASVLFALLQAVKLIEVTLPSANALHTSAIVEVVFILALAYAFYLQRRVFEEHHRPVSGEREDDEELELEPAEVSPYERYS